MNKKILVIFLPFFLLVSLVYASIEVSVAPATASETDPNSLHLSQDNWFNDSKGWLNWDGDSNEYNESKLNQTVLELTQSTTYLPTSFVTTIGTENGGNNIGNLSYSDDQTFNVSELGGMNALEIYINFTGVDKTPDFITMGHQYIGNHFIQLQLWDYDASDWAIYDTIIQQGGLIKDSIAIIDGVNHVQGEIVQVRFTHPSNGNPSEEFRIDFLNIVNGFSTITTNEHDGLSGRNMISNHNWALPTDGSRNFTALNGTGDITTTGNIESNKYLMRLKSGNTQGMNIIGDVDEGIFAGINIAPSYTPPESGALFAPFILQASVLGNSNFSQFVGNTVRPNIFSYTGTMTDLIGFEYKPAVISGTITNAIGLHYNPQFFAGTQTNKYALKNELVTADYVIHSAGGDIELTDGDITTTGTISSNQLNTDTVRDESGTYTLSLHSGGSWYAGDSYSGNNYDSTGWDDLEADYVETNYYYNSNKDKLYAYYSGSEWYTYADYIYDSDASYQTAYFDGTDAWTHYLDEIWDTGSSYQLADFDGSYWHVNAYQYCDESGSNCFYPSSINGGASDDYYDSTSTYTMAHFDTGSYYWTLYTDYLYDSDGSSYVAYYDGSYWQLYSDYYYSSGGNGFVQWDGGSSHWDMQNNLDMNGYSIENFGGNQFDYYYDSSGSYDVAYFDTGSYYWNLYADYLYDTDGNTYVAYFDGSYWQLYADNYYSGTGSGLMSWDSGNSHWDIQNNIDLNGYTIDGLGGNQHDYYYDSTGSYDVAYFDTGSYYWTLYADYYYDSDSTTYMAYFDGSYWNGYYGYMDIDSINIDSNIISSSTGTISFADDNLETTGDVSARTMSIYNPVPPEDYLYFDAQSNYLMFEKGAQAFELSKDLYMPDGEEIRFGGGATGGGHEGYIYSDGTDVFFTGSAGTDLVMGGFDKYTFDEDITMVGGKTITWGSGDSVIEAGTTADDMTFKIGGGGTNRALTLMGLNSTAYFHDWDITTTGMLTATTLNITGNATIGNLAFNGNLDLGNGNLTTTGTICDSTGCIGAVGSIDITLGAKEYGYYNSSILYLKIEMNTTIAGTEYMTGIAIINDSLGIRRVEGNLSQWVS
jgi:hypothetical protein